MIWSLWYRTQGREAILSGETENKDEKLKWYANTTNPSLTSPGCKTHTDDGQPTCSRRMLLSAVSSRSDRSTVSIWLANSWRLWINKLRDIWSCQHELERNRKLGLTLFAAWLRAHLSVAAGDVDDNVVVPCGDGRAVDWNAVNPLLVARNSHSRGFRKPEEMKHVCMVSILSVS